MAKSKNGGTRAYIRGRIGSDVYSVGKNSKGEKQQVVRSLAETVANPRTSSQMFGRMVMSTVMQAVHAFKPIIDHSFDGFPKGQPSISEFIRRNYALVKADAIAHPASGNAFGLNMYGEKGLKHGNFVVSAGSAVLPSTMVGGQGGSSLDVQVGDTPTYGTLKAAWLPQEGEYVTIIKLEEGPTYDADGVITASFARLSLKANLAESTALTADNAAAAFDIEGDFTPAFSLSGSSLQIRGNMNDDSEFYGLQWTIVTRKENGAFIHSDCAITLTSGAKFAADEALPTYPVGTEMFLNGGDL